MDRPSCEICGSQTEWYGWLHGWLCPACQAEELEEEEAEDELVENGNQKQTATDVRSQR